VGLTSCHARGLSRVRAPPARADACRISRPPPRLRSARRRRERQWDRPRRVSKRLPRLLRVRALTAAEAHDRSPVTR